MDSVLLRTRTEPDLPDKGDAGLTRNSSCIYRRCTGSPPLERGRLQQSADSVPNRLTRRNADLWPHQDGEKINDELSSVQSERYSTTISSAEYERRRPIPEQAVRPSLLPNMKDGLPVLSPPRDAVDRDPQNTHC